MSNRLYVGNLPYTTTEADVRNWFAPIEVTEVVFVMDRDTGRPRGFGFVELGASADPGKVIADYDGRELGGRRITVNAARDKPRSNGGARDGGRGRGGRRDDRRREWD